MAKRYSGQITVDVEFVDARGEYKARVSTPDGSETVWVGVPPALGVAVDSAEAYDGAASAAISFAADDYPDLSVGDYASWSGKSFALERHIGRSKATAWSPDEQGSRRGDGFSERRRHKSRESSSHAGKLVRFMPQSADWAQYSGWEGTIVGGPDADGLFEVEWRHPVSGLPALVSGNHLSTKIRKFSKRFQERKRRTGREISLNKPILITKVGTNKYTVHAKGVPVIRRADGKLDIGDGEPVVLNMGDAKGLAHQIGRYKMNLGDFVSGYTAVEGVADVQRFWNRRS